MKIVLTVLLAFVWYLGSAQKTIEGIVNDGKQPIANVSVAIQGNSIDTQTDTAGKYRITAKPGDVIVFSHLGMQTIEIVVEDVTQVLNIKMWPKVEELDEVVVQKRRTKSQFDLELDYGNNKKLIRTAYGIIDTESSPFRIPTLEGDNFSLRGLNILDALRGKFAGITVFSNLDGTGSVFLRGGGSIGNKVPAIYDVDGQIFNDPPTWLFPENIERLAILPGLAGTTRYGSVAAGGVVVINTKISNYRPDPETQKPYDFALLRNNLYNEKALNSAEVLRNAPNYLKELATAKTKDEALAVYSAYNKSFQNSMYFILDTFNKLNNELGEKEAAERILADHRHLFNENPLALKALAYHYQANEDFEKANGIYKEIFGLRPNYAQSYFDLGNSYQETKDFNKALAIYARYNHLIEEGLLEKDDDVFSKIMDRELNNLLSLEGRSLITNKDKKQYTLEEEFDGTRLVFEWNDSEAEFDLQFVNPTKNYFTWQHTLYDMPERIKTEKQLGYSTEEYLIDNELNGLWQVNSIYYGNKQLTPTYLKVTIYQNYGRPSQSKEIKVFRLHLKEVNTKLFTLSNSMVLTLN